MICVGVVSSVTPHPDWSPLCSPKHTRIQTAAMTHHSNNSVRDHMKWVSGSLFISRITIIVLMCFQTQCQCFLLLLPLFNSPSFPWLLVSVRSSRGILFLFWHVVCVARLGCWAARRCCPAWPWCKPTTFPARRRWCHPWGRGTKPVKRATKPIRSIATTTMYTKSTMGNPTTATWAIYQKGVVHHWWAMPAVFTIGASVLVMSAEKGHSCSEIQLKLWLFYIAIMVKQTHLLYILLRILWQCEQSTIH